MWDKERTYCIAYECQNFTCPSHANKVESQREKLKKEKKELHVIWVNFSLECDKFIGIRKNNERAFD